MDAITPLRETTTVTTGTTGTTGTTVSGEASIFSSEPHDDFPNSVASVTTTTVSNKKQPPLWLIFGYLGICLLTIICGITFMGISWNGVMTDTSKFLDLPYQKTHCSTFNCSTIGDLYFCSIEWFNPFTDSLCQHKLYTPNLVDADCYTTQNCNMLYYTKPRVLVNLVAKYMALSVGIVGFLLVFVGNKYLT